MTLIEKEELLSITTNSIKKIMRAEAALRDLIEIKKVEKKE